MTVAPDQLLLEPRPLLFSNHDIVLSWAPKSACSQALVWFFIHEELLKPANEYSSWPHNFRTDKYYDLPRYRQRMQDLLQSEGKGYTLVRITRDPVKRLISCFRHAIRFPTIDRLMKTKLGRAPGTDGLSLTDFHHTLQGEDLACWNGFDMHICAQQHPVWYYDFDRIITLNVDETDLYAGLNQIEKSLGMKKTVFDKFPKFRNLANGHHAKDIAYSGNIAIEDVRFARGTMKEIPKSALLGSPRTREIAQDLHGCDFGHVGSADTAGNLFE